MSIYITNIMKIAFTTFAIFVKMVKVYMLLKATALIQIL